MATTQDQPHYHRVIHHQAQQELQRVPASERETIKQKLRDASLYRHPLEHESVVPLDGHPGLYRIRVGDYRAILDKYLDRIRVLAVGKRAKIYDALDEAKKRHKQS